MDALQEALVDAGTLANEIGPLLEQLGATINDAYSRASARGLHLAVELDGLGPRVQRMRMELARDLKRLLVHAAQAKAEMCEV